MFCIKIAFFIVCGFEFNGISKYLFNLCLHQIMLIVKFLPENFKFLSVFSTVAFAHLLDRRKAAESAEEKQAYGDTDQYGDHQHTNYGVDSCIQTWLAGCDVIGFDVMRHSLRRHSLRRDLKILLWSCNKKFPFIL